MISVEPGVADANGLVYATNADDPKHTASRTLLDAALSPSPTLYLTSQIVCEFYSVITNPRRVANPSSSDQALQVVSALLALPGIRTLPIPAHTTSVLMELLQRHPVTGTEIFDLQIVATMKLNNVPRIYTFNPADFEVFPELIVVVPAS